MWGANIYVLVETKQDGSPDIMYPSIWSNRCKGGMHKVAVGSRGRILIMWNKRIWKGEQLEIGTQSITGKFTGINEEFSCHVTAVYADCNREVRKLLWRELIGVRTSISGPWTICGDFNVTRYSSERTNCNRINGAMTEFAACIVELELIDPPLFGGSFTWRRGEDNGCASRIEGFLHCAQWGERNWEWKNSYFKFESWWPEVEGFKDNIKEWWCSFVVEGRAGYILAEKLKMLKVKLKEWSKENKGNWKQRKDKILNQIANRESIQEQRPLTDDEILQKTNLAMDFEVLARLEEIAWRQRSRIQWLKQDDKNTKFFYRITTSHKRCSSMEKLEVEGITIKELLSKKLPELTLQGISMISEEEQTWLQRAFEEEEILDTSDYVLRRSSRSRWFPYDFLSDLLGSFEGGYNTDPGTVSF
ncbi:unnamed protein product [Withania somnifera]